MADLIKNGVLERELLQIFTKDIVVVTGCIVNDVSFSNAGQKLLNHCTRLLQEGIDDKPTSSEIGNYLMQYQLDLNRYTESLFRATHQALHKNTVNKWRLKDEK